MRRRIEIFSGPSSLSQILRRHQLTVRTATTICLHTTTRRRTAWEHAAAISRTHACRHASTTTRLRVGQLAFAVTSLSTMQPKPNLPHGGLGPSRCWRGTATTPTYALKGAHEQGRLRLEKGVANVSTVPWKGCCTCSTCWGRGCRLADHLYNTRHTAAFPSRQLHPLHGLHRHLGRHESGAPHAMLQLHELHRHQGRHEFGAHSRRHASCISAGWHVNYWL